MADEQGGGTGRRGSSVAMAAVVLLGLGGGTALGVLVVGPLVAPRLAQAVPAGGQPPTEGEVVPTDGEAGPASGESGPVESALFQVENFVVNPAGTEGTRFLMLSMAVEVADSAVVARMRTREPEIRDTMVRVVGRRTVRELADVSLREELAGDLRAALDSLFGSGTVERLFLPQFVIQ